MAVLRLRKLFSISMALMLVVTLGTALITAGQAQAACSSDVWVAPPPTGNDSNPGTQAAPFATIQKGVDEVCAGGTVHVGAGSYTENVLITKSLNLQGAGRDLVTVYKADTLYNYVFEIMADNVRMSGFTVITGPYYGYGILLNKARDCDISNNIATACYYGIVLDAASNNTVSNNNVHHNYFDGIFLEVSTNNVISNNDVHDNWRDGIVLWNSNGNEISDNNIYGNLGWSCPYVYSWNGEDYELDAHMLGNAPRANAEKSDYDSLEHLVPSDGKHLLKLTEEMDETSYVDELKLIAVDHVIGSKVVMDMQGNIHTLCSPYIPVEAVDEEGIECLDQVNAQDGNYWTSNLDNKDLSQDEDLRDGVILTFDKPAGATSAKVVATYRKTGLGAFIHVHWARILPQPPIPPKIRTLGRMLNSLQLQVNDGATWGNRIPFMDTSGSTLGRSDIAFTGDISGIAGNTLTLKVESITGLVDIDSVTVYYADCDEPATSIEVSAASAIDGNGTDVTQLLGADDGNYLVLEKGDYADLNFYYNEPVSPGYERSYFVKANGYYVFPNLTPLPKEVAGNLMGQFKDDYDKAYRFYLEKYYPSSGNNCGINVLWSSNNLISGNQIYDNAYEGIYLYFAHSNRIIGNYIFENDCGIWIDYSNDNEITCNDIRDNMYWSGIALDPYYYYYYYGYYASSGNAIHYNNIVGNLDYGVFSGNDQEAVDAINNWWGATDGPSHSPGSGDKVSDYVDCSPWLTEAVDCEKCAEIGGDRYYLEQVLQKYAGGQAAGPGSSPQNLPHLVPPNLSAQYMNVHPLYAQVNQPVTITTNVVNSGQETGNYDVVLRINGKSEQNKMVSVGPGGTYPVKFTVTKSQPGTYTVNIDGQQASFTIVDNDKITSAPVNGGIIAIIIVSLLIIVTLVMLVRTFQRSTS
ncbi:MAG: right-handed parallel beta-helix repeat-containing protein [Chloroflexota bacterium]|nr:MAG: right-handed parallel beta-helix repeat-containing protein [Chloroflexota bacterium]